MYATTKTYSTALRHFGMYSHLSSDVRLLALIATPQHDTLAVGIKAVYRIARVHAHSHSGR